MTVERSSPPQRLTAGQVVRDAVILLRQSFDSVWAWWFFLFVLETASAASVSLTTPVVAAGHAPPPTPLAMGIALGAGAVAILLGAFALRTMVTGKAERPRLNGGFWAYAGLKLAATAAWMAVTLLSSPLAERAIAFQPPARPPTELVPQMLAALAGFVIMALVFARLALWPVALLVGEKGVGPVGSWRRMRGAVWPLIAGTLLLVLPVDMIGSAALMMIQTPTLPLAAAPVVGLMGALENAVALAVVAAVFRARTGAAPIAWPAKA